MPDLNLSSIYPSQGSSSGGSLIVVNNEQERNSIPVDTTKLIFQKDNNNFYKGLSSGAAENLNFVADINCDALKFANNGTTLYKFTLPNYYQSVPTLVQGTLSQPYDVSTFTQTASFDVSPSIYFDSYYVYDFFMLSDLSKFYISNASQIWQFDLSSPGDINTATYINTFAEFLFETFDYFGNAIFRPSLDGNHLLGYNENTIAIFTMTNGNVVTATETSSRDLSDIFGEYDFYYNYDFCFENNDLSSILYMLPDEPRLNRIVLNTPGDISGSVTLETNINANVAAQNLSGFKSGIFYDYENLYLTTISNLGYSDQVKLFKAEQQLSWVEV